MQVKYSNYYWVFIILLQAFLITEKVINTQTILNDKFYLWNFIVIVCGIVFLYNRFRLNKILLNPEKIIILMIIINGISTTITEIILGINTLRIVMSIIIVLLSILVGSKLKKNEVENQ